MKLYLAGRLAREPNDQAQLLPSRESITVRREARRQAEGIRNKQNSHEERVWIRKKRRRKHPQNREVKLEPSTSGLYFLVLYFKDGTEGQRQRQKGWRQQDTRNSTSQ